MSEKHITRRALNSRPSGGTGWVRLDAMAEEEIAAGAAADAGNGLWSEAQLAQARLVMPGDRAKIPVFIRLDPEVLDYFKASGSRYQTRTNAVLRSYVRSMKASKPAK